MFSLSWQPIDVACQEMSFSAGESGAVVSFEGRVRRFNEGRQVVYLEYEAHEPMAVSEAGRIIAEAKERFGLLKVDCVHRAGTLAIGQLAVRVIVCAAHRAEAFDGCRYIIDQIKLRLPIWKKEYYADGTSEWVNCRHVENSGSHTVQTDSGLPCEVRQT